MKEIKSKENGLEWSKYFSHYNFMWLSFYSYLSNLPKATASFIINTSVGEERGGLVLSITRKFVVKFEGVLMTFHFMCVHIIFSSVWVADWPPFGQERCSLG